MRIDIFHVGVVQTNCYLAYNETTLDAFVVDPGDDAERILQAIEDKGLNLKYVILTHGHFDHLLAVKEICEKSGAVLVASKYAKLDDEDMCGFTSFGLGGFSPLKAGITVSDGDVLKLGESELSFIETPGHTPCSMCILMGNTLFSGDTLFAGSCGRCDLPGGDYSVILKSLAKLSKLPGDLKVLPGHGDATSIERECRLNPYMREAMQ